MSRAYKGWKARWCVKCATIRPVRSRRTICVVCGERTGPDPAKGNGGYNAEKVEGPYSGKIRDSKQEAGREPLLQALANVGRITDLEFKPAMYPLEVYSTQAVDVLLEELRSTAGELTSFAQEAIEAVERSRQRIGGYTPDFQYCDHTGELVVEDVKGWKISQDFPLRKKLMVACHNIEVQVIKEQRGVQQWARGAGAKGKATGSLLRGNRALKRGASAALKGER